MNQDEFIKAIKVTVHDATIKGMAQTLIEPPGRQPQPKLQFKD